MFTGLIEEIGAVRDIRVSGGGRNITIAASAVLADSRVGDSISIDGACQTITSMGGDFFTVFASGVTCEVTTLGGFRSGRWVNLERAMAVNSRIGGHLVQGHVDGRGRIMSVDRDPEGMKIGIGAPGGISRYLVERGSVALNGVSLTVVSAAGDAFKIYIIPETLRKTTFGGISVNDEVNIEVDILAKYVEKMLLSNRDGKRDDALMKKLIEGGFV
jgi:riboflavin synthase